MKRKRLTLAARQALVLIPLNIAAVSGAPNLLRNGDFTQLDETGKPRYWRVSFGGKGVEGRWSLAKGPAGKRAVRMECTRFPEDGGPGWIILMQEGTVTTTKGQNLYVSFWARREGMETGQVQLAIMRRRPWGKLVTTGVRVSDTWSKVELVVTPTSDCRDTRFEIYFQEVGALLVSDVHVEPTRRKPAEFNPIRLQMKRQVSLDKQKNIVRNGSFEVGSDGWGTEEFDYNVVQVDRSQAVDGHASARIDLQRSSLPAGYSDYPAPRKLPFQRVTFAARGWMRFEKGATYSLSAYLRSASGGQRAELGVSFMIGGRSTRGIDVTPEWRRYTLTFPAKDLFGFVFISASTGAAPASLWVDAVQLERGPHVTNYTSKYPVEVAFLPRRPGGVYYVGEPILWDVAAHCAEAAAAAEATVRVTDYRGQPVHEQSLRIAAKSPPSRLRLPLKNNGFYQLVATVRGKGFTFDVQRTFVIIYPYAATYGDRDGRFGVNHPYYTDLLQAAARDAGVGWVRDWSLKWDVVEPQPGRWEFDGPDLFLKRAQRLGQRVLAILPDPSSSWASTGPPQARGRHLGDTFELLWYLPRNLDDFRRYVRTCVTRFHSQVHVWEVLNEPYQSKTREWKVEQDYNRFLGLVKDETARAGADQRVARCGLIYFGDHEAANAQVAGMADVLSEHVYPLYNRTRRFIAHVARIQQFLDRHHVSPEIWFTEYGKYANDYPPYQQASFNHYLANGDERVAAAYNVKYLAVLFGRGVGKVFFHQRTWPLGMNRRRSTPFDMLFDYGPRPFKFFVAANAMAWMLPPGARADKPVNERGPVFAYSFARAHDKVLVVWTDKTPVPLDSHLARRIAAVSAYGMMGDRLTRVERLDGEPLYLVGPAQRIDAIAADLADLTSSAADTDRREETKKH